LPGAQIFLLNGNQGPLKRPVQHLNGRRRALT